MKKQEKQGLNNEIDSKKNMDFWQRILLGTAGGVFITGGLWIFTLLPQDTKYLTLIPILLGIGAIFYARYG